MSLGPARNACSLANSPVGVEHLDNLDTLLWFCHVIEQQAATLGALDLVSALVASSTVVAGCQHHRCGQACSSSSSLSPIFFSLNSVFLILGVPCIFTAAHCQIVGVCMPKACLRHTWSLDRLAVYVAFAMPKEGMFRL